VFVLTDNLFIMKSRVIFPCGLIRGALSNLGVDALVIAESVGSSCTIQIKIK
jgi:hypothetical protein